jgi:hypothetical protein
MSISGVIKKLRTERTRTWLVPKYLENPYSTHAPVLIGLSKTLRPKRVVEFGGGAVSTRLFLDRNFFPQLEKLITLEDDAAWAHQLNQWHAGDDRFEVRHPGDRDDLLKMELDKADLVFVDNAQSAHERAKTVYNVLQIQRKFMLVVHDAEKREYARRFYGRTPIYVDAWRPLTAIIPSDEKQRVIGMEVRRVIKLNRLKPDAYSDWPEAFH